MPFGPDNEQNQNKNMANRAMSPDMELAVSCSVPSRERPGALQDRIQKSFELNPPTVSATFVKLFRKSG